MAHGEIRKREIMKYYIGLDESKNGYVMIKGGYDTSAYTSPVEINKDEFYYINGLDVVSRYRRQRYIYAKKNGFPAGRDDKGISSWEDIDLIPEYGSIESDIPVSSKTNTRRYQWVHAISLAVVAVTVIIASSYARNIGNESAYYAIGTLMIGLLVGFLLKEKEYTWDEREVIKKEIRE